MLTTFEHHTADIDIKNRDELRLVNDFITGFNLRKGKDKAISNKEIRAAYAGKGVQLTDVKIRKIVNYIRTHDLVPCLVANSKGYYVAATEEEMNDYIKSLTQRCNEIDRVRAAAIRQKDRTFKKAA